jgi:hypothetical protein
MQNNEKFFSFGFGNNMTNSYIYNLKNNNQIHHVVDGSSFVDRIYNALKLVKTIFCKINSDDDFFSKNYILDKI